MSFRASGVQCLRCHAPSAASEDWRKALHLLETLQPRRLLEEVSICAAMSMCTRCAQGAQIELGRGSLPRPSRLGLARASYWAASLALFADLVFHVDPDPVTFSAALAACSSGSQWTTAPRPARVEGFCRQRSTKSKAILLLNEMTEIAVQADAICFNSAAWNGTGISAITLLVSAG